MAGTFFKHHPNHSTEQHYSRIGTEARKRVQKRTHCYCGHELPYAGCQLCRRVLEAFVRRSGGDCRATSIPVEKGTLLKSYTAGPKATSRIFVNARGRI